MFGRSYAWLAAGTVLAVAVFHGCSSDEDEGSSTKKDAGSDSSTGGSAGDSGGPDANCTLNGVTCASNADCCSANCDPTLKTCANPVGACKAGGEACSTATDCCSVVCDNGKCGQTLCTSDNQPCTTDAQCCGQKCGDGDGGKVCIPLSSTCKTAGNSCGTNGECCSGVCTNGNCSSKVSFCTQSDDTCTTDAECCTGICTKASGAAVGTCTQPSAPGTTGCLAAGEVCGAGADGGVSTDGGLPACGGECCSRSCAPYGPTGVFVCQPPSGCRPTGELCKKDSDCCGSAGMPGGNGSVKCSIGAGESVGRCDNGNSCRPAGAVCKLATSSCNAENNCCAGNVNQDPTVCQQDLLGIPRCTGVGSCADAGSMVGKACATSADCCGLPCLPNGTGGFVCGGACVAAGGACSTDADCCAGLPCKLPPGSSQGICGYTEIPDSGTDAQIPDAQIPDGGSCSLYGQSCTTSANCCNNVPCTNGKCVYPVQ